MLIVFLHGSNCWVYRESCRIHAINRMSGSCDMSVYVGYCLFVAYKALFCVTRCMKDSTGAVGNLGSFGGSVLWDIFTAGDLSLGKGPYRRRQKVGIWAWDDLCCFSFLSSRTVVFQLLTSTVLGSLGASGFGCVCSFLFGVWGLGFGCASRGFRPLRVAFLPCTSSSRDQEPRC